MRRSALVLWIVAASVATAACGGGSGFVYHGPKPPARKTQPSAISEAPPPGRAEREQELAAIRQAEAEAAGATASGAPVGEPRVLTPVPRTRTNGDGPIIVIAPDRGRLDEPVLPEDLRTPAQIKKDQEAWDRCVVQAAFRESEQISSSAAPVQATPEALCAEKLGMEGRNTAPRNRR